MKYYDFLDNEDENIIKRAIDGETDNVLHGILVFNIDNFIVVNEMYGRTTGDKVLKTVQERINGLFRGNDVVVKLRGDEFIVFNRCISELSNIELLAYKLLKEISSICVNDAFNLTASVGLALYPFHGTTYAELKNKAYQSMYRAKANGKNSYRLYDSARTKALYHDYLSNKELYGSSEGNDYFAFGTNKSYFDLCTSMFHENKDSVSALTSILELSCIYFGFSRGYVYTKQELTEADFGKLRYANAGFEYGKESEIFRALKEDMICRLSERYKSLTLVEVTDESVDPEVVAFMDEQGISQMMYFPIVVEDKLRAHFVLENMLEEPLEFSDEEIRTLDEQLRSIQIYFYHCYEKKNHKEHLARLELFENLDACVYIIDSKTHIVEYENRKAGAIQAESCLGLRCHEVFCNQPDACADCPLKEMDIDDSHANASIEKFNFATRSWAKNLFSWMDMAENKGKAIMISVDINDYFDALKD